MERPASEATVPSTLTTPSTVEVPRRTILVTGAAGFIGSHLTRDLLLAGHAVRGIDNLSAVGRTNLPAVTWGLTPAQAARFTFLEGDVLDGDACTRAADGTDVVVHLAAANTVPRSFAEPSLVVATNTVGTTTVLEAAVRTGVRRVVLASSSAVYGDTSAAVRTEHLLGRPTSPYGASKRAGELLAQAYSSAYGVETVALRYFNVFGARQSADGDDAAVIARWVARALAGRPIEVFGSGHQTRDFIHVSDVVDATRQAATVGSLGADAYNVGSGVATSLLRLLDLLGESVAELHPTAPPLQVRHHPPRRGDVAEATADVRAAARDLGHRARTSLADGLQQTVTVLLRAPSVAASRR